MGYAADEEIDTAYHEAGHAVLGCVVGRYPLSVTIVRVGAVAGKNEYEAGVPDFARKYLNQSREKQLYAERRVLTELAGSIAHDLFKPGRPQDMGDDTDLHFTRELISELVSWQDQDEYLKQAQVKADGLLRLHWTWVEAVALALVEHKTLSRADVLALRPRNV
jgi:hypothetical protein